MCSEQRTNGLVSTQARHGVVALFAICAATLVPWIAYLAWTLPAEYAAQNWDLASIGFDVLLLALLVSTALLTRARHRLAPMTAFATGIVLVCDSWFDWATSGGAAHTVATATALLVELPLAALLMAGALTVLSRYAPPAAA